MTLLKIIAAAVLMLFAMGSMLFAGFSLAEHEDRDVAAGFGLAAAACAAALWVVASI